MLKKLLRIVVISVIGKVDCKESFVLFLIMIVFVSKILFLCIEVIDCVFIVKIVYGYIESCKKREWYVKFCNIVCLMFSVSICYGGVGENYFSMIMLCLDVMEWLK